MEKQMTKMNLVLPLAAISGFANATIWNAAADFSTMNGNPNGTWFYGSKAPDNLGGGFLGTYVTFENELFRGWQAERVDAGAPGVAMNISDHTVSGIKPGELSMHPGSDYPPYNDYLNQVATVRWTAPLTGQFNIYGMFGQGDTNYAQGRGDVNVYIYVNGVSRFQVLETFYDQDFYLSEFLSQGDTVDFMVGNGRNNDFAWDSTPLYATVESVPEPMTMVLFGGALAVALKRRKQNK
jgi:hypothetical protein